MRIKNWMGIPVVLFLGVVSSSLNSYGQYRKVEDSRFSIVSVNKEIKQLDQVREVLLHSFVPQSSNANGVGCPIADSCMVHSMSMTFIQSIGSGIGSKAGAVFRVKYFINNSVVESKDVTLPEESGTYTRLIQFATAKDLNNGSHRIDIYAFSNMVSTQSNIRWTTIQSLEPHLGITRTSATQQAALAAPQGGSGVYNSSLAKLPVNIVIPSRLDGSQLLPTVFSLLKETSILGIKPSITYTTSGLPRVEYLQTTQYSIPLLSNIPISLESGSRVSSSYLRPLPATRAHYQAWLMGRDYAGMGGGGPIVYKVNTIGKPQYLGGPSKMLWECSGSSTRLNASLPLMPPKTYINSASTPIAAGELAGYYVILTHKGDPNVDASYSSVHYLKASDLVYDLQTGATTLNVQIKSPYLQRPDLQQYLRICPVGSDGVEGLCEIIPTTFSVDPICVN